MSVASSLTTISLIMTCSTYVIISCNKVERTSQWSKFVPILQVVPNICFKWVKGWSFPGNVICQRFEWRFSLVPYFLFTCDTFYPKRTIWGWNNFELSSTILCCIHCDGSITSMPKAEDARTSLLLRGFFLLRIKLLWQIFVLFIFSTGSPFGIFCYTFHLTPVSSGF